MKFTLNWLKDHLDTSKNLDTIVETLTNIGLEIEDVEDKSKTFNDFTVAEVLKAEQHPDADRLKVCSVKTIDGTFQVVCGAPNARTGMKGIFAPENSFIPGTGIKLKKSKMKNEKTVEEISSDAKRLSDLAHNNKLMPEDYQGGTFSISNLGMLGIKSFTAVINPPQCGILAVGKLEDDKISVTMSCDHRGIDGAVGARFLQTLSTIVAEVDI